MEWIRNICLLGHVYNQKYQLIPLISGVCDGVLGNERDRRKIETILTRLHKLPVEICNIILDDYLNRQSPILTQLITINNYKGSKNKSYTFNIIDLPGLPDYIGNMTHLPMISLTDGALLIIDTTRGICQQTQHAIKQMILQNMKCVLLIDNFNTYFQFPILLESNIHSHTNFNQKSSIMDSYVNVRTAKNKAVLKSDENKNSIIVEHLQSCFLRLLNTVSHVTSLLNENGIINNSNNSNNSNNRKKNEYDGDSDVKSSESQVWFGNEMICFGSVEGGWGFSLIQFADMYTCKFGLSKKSLMNKLFSEKYWNSDTKKWTSNNTNNKNNTNTLKSGFVQFILLPIYTLYKHIIENKKQSYGKMIKLLNIKCDWKCQEMSNGTPIMKANYILRQWLPMRNILLNLMIDFIPSPISNESKKISIKSTLGTGNTNVRNQNHIQNESKQHASILISHFIPMESVNICKDHTFLTNLNVDKNESNSHAIGTKFIAIGRVFEGTIQKGDKMNVFPGSLLTNSRSRWYHHQRNHQPKKKIEQLVRFKYCHDCKEYEAFEIDSCQTGNLCGIVSCTNVTADDDNNNNRGSSSSNQSTSIFGNTSFLQHGTLTTRKRNLLTSFSFQPDASQSNLVSIQIEPIDPKDLPKMVEGLRRLQKIDVSINTYVSPTGGWCISGAGRYHLEASIKNFRCYCVDNDHSFPLKLTPNLYDLGDTINDNNSSIISLRETIAETTNTSSGIRFGSRNICMAKSPNKHSRLYMNAEPLNEQFIQDIENGTLLLPPELTAGTTSWLPSDKSFARRVSENKEYNWKYEHSRKIWTFGYSGVATSNCLVDVTKGLQFLGEIKEYVVCRFLQCSSDGIICGCPLRGIRFNLIDCKLNADSIHRGAGQIMPSTRRVLYACQLASTPRLMKPLYKFEIVIIFGIINYDHVGCDGFSFEETSIINISNNSNNNNCNDCNKKKKSGDDHDELKQFLDIRNSVIQDVLSLIVSTEKRGTIETMPQQNLIKNDCIGTRLYNGDECKIEGLISIDKSFDLDKKLSQIEVKYNGMLIGTSLSWMFVEIKFQLMFSHWKMEMNNPFVQGSDVYELMMDKRKLNGLSITNLPQLSSYCDRI